MKEYIITTIIGLAIAVIGYFLKQTMSRLQRVEDKLSDANECHESKAQHDKDIKEFKEQHKNDISECKKEIEKLRTEINKIANRYLEREEFIRSMATINQKFDRIEDNLNEQLKNTNTKLDRLLELVYREE